MSITKQLRDDAGQLWDRVREGWNSLRSRSTLALTHYHDEEEDERSVGWGVLAADVVEHGDHFDIEIELPGMTREELSVSVLGDQLSVSGVKRYTAERVEGNLVLRERGYGRFDRVIPLGTQLDPAQCEAHYRNGVLAIRLGKRDGGDAQTIAVQD